MVNTFIIILPNSLTFKHCHLVFGMSCTISKAESLDTEHSSDDREHCVGGFIFVRQEIGN